jgi:hypothetical protein
MTIEECLLEVGAKAALVRYFASFGAVNPELPDPAVSPASAPCRRRSKRGGGGGQF